VFFQYDKEVKIVGNSSTNPYMNVIEVCCKGWRRYEYDWSQCVPDCGERCQENGFCVAGGKCVCFTDFVLNYRNNVVTHKAIIALALTRNLTASVLAATLRPAHGYAHQTTGRVSGAADLDQGQPVGLVRLDDTGVRVLFHSIGAARMLENKKLYYN